MFENILKQLNNDNWTKYRQNITKVSTNDTILNFIVYVQEREHRDKKENSEEEIKSMMKYYNSTYEELNSMQNKQARRYF